MFYFRTSTIFANYVVFKVLVSPLIPMLATKAAEREQHSNFDQWVTQCLLNYSHMYTDAFRNRE